MYILYDFIFLVFAIIYLPYLFLTHRYHSRFIERFGIFNETFSAALKNEKVIWLHAVSVGEVIAASPFIKKFYEHFPGYRLLISTVTKTGNNIASKIKGKKDFLIYLPLDLSFVMNKVLAKIKPKLFIIMETEIWPNIITAFHKKGIPIVLINGRLSGRSFRAYSKVKLLLKDVFKRVGLFCMQTSSDATRLKALGVDESRIRITGNMKYDAIESFSDEEHNKLRPFLGIPEDKKILVAGSTHRGEDEVILDTYREILKKFPELILLIAPRHIERTEEIERMAFKYNLKCRRFSSSQKDSSDAQIIILDVMGKLKALYAMSDIVFIGGSLFSKYGGHNIIEPAVFKKPILFGPHMANFKDMANFFLKESAAIQVKDKEDIKKACELLLADVEESERIGQAAFDIINQNKGATIRNISYIEDVLTKGRVD